VLIGAFEHREGSGRGQQVAILGGNTLGIDRIDSASS
jgi:hypothetical protein